MGPAEPVRCQGGPTESRSSVSIQAVLSILKVTFCSTWVCTEGLLRAPALKWRGDTDPPPVITAALSHGGVRHRGNIPPWEGLL